MSPRKTRRAKAKHENVEESISTSDDSPRRPETPPMHSRTLRIRKTKEPSASTSKTPKKVSDEMVEDSPRPVRKNRTHKNQWEMSVASNETLSSPTTTRKRQRKIKNETSDEEKAEPVPKKTRARKKRANASRINDTLLNDNSSKGQFDEEDIEVAVASSKAIVKKSPTNLRFQKLKESPENVITPESSPITVSLTPHRSTKTPRKSPINLGSPKTHTLSSGGLSKTPRKLSVIASSSPVPSEITLASGTSKKPTVPQENPEIVTEQSALSNLKRTPSKTPKIVLRKATSKSPPAVRSSKIKKASKRSPSRKKSTTPKKSVSPNKFVTPEKALTLQKSVSSQKTPKMMNKSSMSAEKLPKSAKKSARSSKKSLNSSDQMKRDIHSNIRSPQLILERVQSPPASGAKAEAAEPIPTRQLHLTSRLHSLARNELRSSTPREHVREIRRSLNMSGGTSPLTVSKFYGSLKSLQANVSKSCLIEDTSDPLISDDDSFNMSGVNPTDDDDERNRTKSINKNNTYELVEPKTPNLRQQKARTKNDNDTYELDEPRTPGLRKKAGKRSLIEMNEGEADGPAPKRACKVRFANPDIETPVKSSHGSTRGKTAIGSRSATPSAKLAQKRTPDVRVDRRLSNSLTNLSERSPNITLRTRTPSMGDVRVAKWNQKMMNESSIRLSRARLSNVLTDTDKKKKKKIDAKSSSSTKKVPNFAQIHLKKFEKMESLVENKKRLEERHTALTNTKLANVDIRNETDSSCSTARKTAPEKAVRSLNFGAGGTKNGFTRFRVSNTKSPVKAQDMKAGGYNRFGYKLRKQEATKIINKSTAVKVEEKREQKRIALKGVRTNKRFELLMKSRNLQL